MSANPIPWQRFWVPRGTFLPFLGPLERTADHLQRAGGMTLEGLRSTHAVALLGEPGMGKTTTLEQELPSLQKHCAESGAELLNLNLASYRSEERLERALFANATVEHWKRGSHALHLLLDSFDEGHLRLDTMGSILSEGLQSLPRDRLFLRVACRPAIWPGTLEDALRRLWPDDFLVMELAPLTQRDLQEAARTYQVDPDAFLHQVRRLGVDSLAVRPVTLKMLLKIFQHGGALPNNRWQLYLDGCLHLARENSRSREESSLLRSSLGGEQRLAIASRIAALTLLSNRDPICSESADPAPSHGITLEELTGGEEEQNGQPVPVTRDAVREVLDSGLFRAIEGPRLLTWAHRTYEEFLAALFLRQRGLTRPQLQQLLCNPEDPRPGIISLLQGVATWLVSQDSHFRSDLLQLDSWMLLTSDALTLDAGLQEPLVRALLESARKDPATLHESEARTHYRKLAHPRLGPQLRAYLREPGAPVPVRGLALRIALACKERSLAPEYLDLALEATAPLPLRIQALDALRELGDGTPDARLLPMAKLDAAMDPNGELRDRALSWLWPGVLSTEQLFEALRDPGEDAPMERTQEAILERLPPQELPSALRWIHAYLSQPKPLRLVGLANELLSMAFDLLDEPGVFAPFCSALWAKLNRALQINPDLRLLGEVRDLPWDWTARTDEERWCIIDGLAAHRESPDELRLLAEVKPPLLFEQDFAAVLLRTQLATSPEEQARWAHLISCCYPWGSSEPLEAIFQVIERDARLEPAFSWLLKASRLEERPELIRVRHVALDTSGFELALLQRLHESSESVQEKCEQILQRIESANPRDWFPLVDVLRASPDQRPDLLGTWRWRKLPKAVQDRIVRAAQFVLSQLRPQAEPWVEGESPGWASCIYEAFNLLAARDSVALNALPESTWRDWASLLLASPASASDSKNEFRRVLVERASRHAPVDVMRTFRRILARAGEDSSRHTRASAFLQSLTGCWNETLHQVALEALRNPATPPSLMVRLFEILLLQQVPEVQALAESVLRDPGGTSRERKVDATRVLLTHGPVALASELWAFLQADEDFAREVLEGCNDHSYTFAGRHEPGLLADIYLWIEHHGRAPHSPDKALGWRMRIQLRSLHQLQQQIRDRLPERMTRSAEAALERLCHEIPGDETLQQKLYFARQFTRSRTWTPPSPRELLEMVGSRRKRLVRNGRELLDTLLESLQRLEEELHGVTPAVRFLWNEERDDQWSPKRELQLSDWVKLHLQKDLAGRRLVVNREVEIRPTLPSRSGERVDLQVDAIANQGGSEERLSVLIEVKIADNRELWTAMRDQLVRRYLSENQLRYGIYLVGWYACAQWNKTTSHPVERRPSLARAKELLEEQARSLSQGGVEVRAFILDAAFRPEHG